MNSTEINIDQAVSEKFKEYRRMIARIKVLEKYPIGHGMYLSSSNEEDKLQDLHNLLKDMPTYMYLNLHEQGLEEVALNYLTRFPIGTRSQMQVVKSQDPLDDEDKQKLKQLSDKIKNVIDARSGDVKGYEAVVKRISEMQELQSKVNEIDYVLEILKGYKPKYVELLRANFIEGKTIEETIELMDISKRTFERLKPKAIKEFAYLIGLAE